MIEVFPHSALSIFVAIIIKYYLITHHIHSKIKLSFSHYPYKNDSPTTYFIIKSGIFDIRAGDLLFARHKKTFSTGKHYPYWQ